MKLYKSVLLPTLLGMSFVTNATEKLTIYAASSMTNAVADVVSAFEKHNDVKVTTVFAGSSSLARQLAHGAPADIFISANTKWGNPAVSAKSQNVVSLFIKQFV